MSLVFEKRNHVAYLTLNRPEVHNSIDPDTCVELLEAWKNYRDDKDCRCAIITGAGEKSFCSGLDLAKTIPLMNGVKKPESDTEKRIDSDPLLIDEATLRNFEIYKPIIAAINGYAIAAGMEIIQGTDIRFAVPHARFGLQEVKWAITPRGGSTVRLPRQIPYCQAMEIMLTGELIDAEEALRIGFINRIVPADKLMEVAEKTAFRIVQNGPLAIRAIKESVIKSIGLTIPQGLDLEAKLATPVFKSNDAKEGPKAFVEKRKPIFKGE